jgi:hypothetical protein
MSSTLTDRPAQAVDDAPLPRRPRRRLLTGPSAVLLAVVTCAAGFYAGIRVEKGQVSSSPATPSFAGAAAGRAGATGSSGFAGLAGGRGGAGGSSGFPVPGGATGGLTAGTVSSVNGRTVVLKEASGDTVKVRLSSATTVDKTEKKRRTAIRPGDTITVTGTTAKSGTVSAASVSDSGNTSSTTVTGSGPAASAGGGSRAAIRSLFGG